MFACVKSDQCALNNVLTGSGVGSVISSINEVHLCNFKGFCNCGSFCYKAERSQLKIVQVFIWLLSFYQIYSQSLKVQSSSQFVEKLNFVINRKHS